MQNRDPNQLPLPFRTNTELWVSGRWGGGGRATVDEADRRVSFQLPPALFAVVAVLILAAKQAWAEGSWARAFVSVEELGRQLARRTQGTANPLLPDPQHTIRYVFRLRRALQRALEQPLDQRGSGLVRARSRPAGPTLDASEWVKSFVEFIPFLGYRLSSHPDRLHLEIIEEMPDGKPPDG